MSSFCKASFIVEVTNSGKHSLKSTNVYPGLYDGSTFPKDIEKEFSINRSTTSEMLKLMCKNGMITREEVDYDARLKKIVLTEASRQHNRNIEDKMRKCVNN